MCSGLLHGTLGFYKTISKTCVLPPSFFFQHLNEKENQLTYVLTVLYKQCIKNDLALFIQEEGHNIVPDLQKKTNFWVSAGGSCAVLIGCGCVWWTCWPSVSQTCSIGDILALNVSQESCSNSSAAQTQLQSASASVCISQWVWCHWWHRCANTVLFCLFVLWMCVYWDTRLEIAVN